MHLFQMRYDQLMVDYRRVRTNPNTCASILSELHLQQSMCMHMCMYVYMYVMYVRDVCTCVWFSLGPRDRAGEGTREDR